MFQMLYKSYTLSYPSKTKQICLIKVTKKSNSMKNDEDFSQKMEIYLKELNGIQKIKKCTLQSYWAKQSMPSTSSPFSLSSTTSKLSSTATPSMAMSCSITMQSSNEESEAINHSKQTVESDSNALKSQAISKQNRVASVQIQ